MKISTCGFGVLLQLNEPSFVESSVNDNRFQADITDSRMQPVVVLERLDLMR